MVKAWHADVHAYGRATLLSHTFLHSLTSIFSTLQNFSILTSTLTTSTLSGSSKALVHQELPLISFMRILVHSSFQPSAGSTTKRLLRALISIAFSFHSMKAP